jgi:hypothetical protein
MNDYEQLYSDFIKNYSLGSTTGEQVGELVARLAGYYPNYNAAMAKAERAYALTCRDEVLKTDETTGKAISATKAETIANASTDASAFKMARVHVQNLEMLIQSAKSLQRGLLQEMSHTNLQ